MIFVLTNGKKERRCESSLLSNHCHQRVFPKGMKWDNAVPFLALIVSIGSH